MSKPEATNQVCTRRHETRPCQLLFSKFLQNQMPQLIESVCVPRQSLSVSMSPPAPAIVSSVLWGSTYTTWDAWGWFVWGCCQILPVSTLFFARASYCSLRRDGLIPGGADWGIVWFVGWFCYRCEITYYCKAYNKYSPFLPHLCKNLLIANNRSLFLLYTLSFLFSNWTLSSLNFFITTFLSRCNSLWLPSLLWPLLPWQFPTVRTLQTW